METWGFSGQTVEDFTLYSGTLGAAFLLFRAYQVTGNANELSLCLEIVKACDAASASSGYPLLLPCPIAYFYRNKLL